MKFDDDLLEMTSREMLTKFMELRSAVRKHRDEKNQDRCQVDDAELYKYLPENRGADLHVDPPAVFLRGCVNFRFTRCGNRKRLSILEAVQLALYAWRKSRLT
jgi:hypothetical protein